MIPKKDLKVHSYYIGSGRGSHVAMWNGKSFVWPANEMGHWGVDEGGHYEDGGCFLPMEEIPAKYPTVAQVDSANWREKVTANALWNVIANTCGAPETLKSSFIRQALEALDRKDQFEFRFKGSLGNGGKLFLDMDGRARVSCYREDETPEILTLIETANRKLQRISGR